MQKHTRFVSVYWIFFKLKKEGRYEKLAINKLNSSIRIGDKSLSGYMSLIS